ncbi:MAG TPA: hypothetical protein PLV62_06700 [Spirochaetota bacterium]|nr:hypothetical protein [Spirochaetota bacterium]
MLQIIVINNSYSAEKLLSFPVGITYDSIYWWRGVELNGKGAGVIWPKVGCEVSGVQAYITIGINQDYYMTTEGGDNDLAKTYPMIIMVLYFLMSSVTLAT